jgi:DNA-binding XRE family transcriptional regulator
MPRGIPKSGVRKQRLQVRPSREMTKLQAQMEELNERLVAIKERDKALAKIVSIAREFGLSPSDMREAATQLGSREVGDAPVLSENIAFAKRLALGQKLKAARKAKGLTTTVLCKAVGASSTGAISLWERGQVPSKAKYREGLIKQLGLPKDFFAEAGPTTLRGVKRKTNGAAHL